jgi:hypothetical protein
MWRLQLYSCQPLSGSEGTFPYGRATFLFLENCTEKERAKQLAETKAKVGIFAHSAEFPKKAQEKGMT